MQPLTLPKTRLSFRDGELVKHGVSDSVQARFAAPELQFLRVVESREYGVAFVVSASMLALAFVAKTHIESSGWAWVATIACLAGAAFGLGMIKARKVLVVTKSGEVAYLVGDQFDDVDGFVLAVNQQLGAAPESAAPIEQESRTPYTP
jgi:hypothetical protein